MSNDGGSVKRELSKAMKSEKNKCKECSKQLGHSILALKRVVRVVLDDRKKRKDILSFENNMKGRQDLIAYVRNHLGGATINCRDACFILSDEFKDRIRKVAQQLRHAKDTLAVGILANGCFPLCDPPKALESAPPTISIGWVPNGRVQMALYSALRFEEKQFMGIPDILASYADMADGESNDPEDDKDRPREDGNILRALASSAAAEIKQKWYSTPI